MAEVRVERIVAPQSEGEVVVPYWEVASGQPGPRVFLLAAQHGAEVQGSEAARRLVADAATRLQAGSLLVVPCANPRALRLRRHNLNSAPEKPHGADNSQNMNCLWPGDPEGNDTQRLVHALHVGLAEQATHCLDMHCWARFLAAAVLPHPTMPESCRFAEVSGFPLAFPWPLPNMQAEPAPTRFNVGMYFGVTGRGTLTFELAGQYLINERQVHLGLRCAQNMLRVLGMLPGEPEGLDEGPTWADRSQVVKVTAPRSGLFVEADQEPGGWVQEGDLLGHLLSAEDLATVPVTAPVTGRLTTYGCHRPNCDVALPDQHPYADEGDELAAIMPV